MRSRPIDRWRPGGWLAQPPPATRGTDSIRPPVLIQTQLPHWRTYEIAERALLDQPTPESLAQYSRAVRTLLQDAMMRLRVRQHQSRSSAGPMRQWVWVQQADDQLKTLADALRGLDATGLLRATGQLRGILLNLWC